MLQQPFALALVGVLGTGVGVIASLLPLLLLGSRDLHDRVSKMWGLLDYEMSLIAAYGGIDMHNVKLAIENLPAAVPPDSEHMELLGTFSHMPSMSWQTVASKGDFIDQASAEIHADLSGVYIDVANLNSTTDRYNLYISTSLADLSFRQNVGNMYGVILPDYEKLSPQLPPLQVKLQEQRENHASRARRLSWMLLGLGVLACIFSWLL